MFSAITIRAQSLDNVDAPIDIGNLLECLLFYKTVYVVATQKMLRQLVRAFGTDNLERLLESQSLVILFSDEMLGIHSNAAHDLHRPIMISSAEASPQYSLLEELKRLAVELTGKTGKGRRIALRLEKLIPKLTFDDSFKNGLYPLLSNQPLVETAVKTILRRLVPEFTGEVQFAPERTPDGIVVHSNLDFAALNRYYHTRVSPKHSSLSPALMLSYVSVAESHLYLAARQLSELSVDPIGADLVEARFVHLMTRSKRSEMERHLFSELLLDDAKAIREAFNTGKVPISEVVPVIMAAGRFKDWLVKQDADKNILREYYKEISKGNFIDRLPGKTARWATFAGIGIMMDAVLPLGIGKAAEVMLSAVDNFFVEKMAKGWTPNQFIDEHLQPLLKKAESDPSPPKDN
ncbi:MAG: hypothetical protein LV481_02270 [Methylacidiphilales bacterium]|nr:hypothetical protein [Candidatus Methylacidiphilales bacterium]